MSQPIPTKLPRTYQQLTHIYRFLFRSKRGRRRKMNILASTPSLCSRSRRTRRPHAAHWSCPLRSVSPLAATHLHCSGIPSNALLRIFTWSANFRTKPRASRCVAHQHNHARGFQKGFPSNELRKTCVRFSQ